MAQFKGTIRGQRGEASRLGSKASGLTVTANGWSAGVKVFAGVDHEGNDRFQIILTGGSHGPDRGVIAEVIDGRLCLDPWGDFESLEEKAEQARGAGRAEKTEGVGFGQRGGVRVNP